MFVTTTNLTAFPVQQLKDKLEVIDLCNGRSYGIFTLLNQPTEIWSAGMFPFVLHTLPYLIVGEGVITGEGGTFS